MNEVALQKDKSFQMIFVHFTPELFEECVSIIEQIKLFETQNSLSETKIMAICIFLSFYHFS
jgi:hypothetical protein